MKVFRLSKKKYSGKLDGKGAALSGNRWNSKGIEMVYTAESRALAMAELAVHLSLTALPSDYQMIEIDIPDSIMITEINVKHLDSDWNINPPSPSTQEIGNDFIHENKCMILKVPSAVVKGDYNFLINPAHKGFDKIKVKGASDFIFDKRLFK